MTFIDIMVILTFIDPQGTTHKVQLNLKGLRRVRGEERLIYGSLVLLSADDFSTFFCGTIASQDAKDLRQVIFHDEINVNELRKTYTMIESPAYFEVKHNYTLQHISSLPASSSSISGLPACVELPPGHRQ